MFVLEIWAITQLKEKSNAVQKANGKAASLCFHVCYFMQSGLTVFDLLRMFYGVVTSLM